MNSYIIMVRASWITSDEHPLGRRPNIVRKKSKSLQKTFESLDDESARHKARKMIAEFKKDLPEKKDSYGSSISKPEIKFQHLARIISL